MIYYVYNPLTRNNTGSNIFKKNSLKNVYNCTIESEMNLLKNKLSSNDIIYIIGGDGTIHYLLNNYNFIFDYKLKYFKNGSGNDFYRSLTTDNSYYYTINNKYHFINSFGIGFDALVCEKVNQETKKTKLSYIKQCYLSLKQYQAFDLDIIYNNNEYHYKKVWLCSLQNGKYFGGGINIAKNASVSNPELELCIGHNLNRLTVLILLIFVKFGLTHLFKKYFFTVKVDKVLIKNSTSLISQLDGDIATINSDIELSAKHLIQIKKTNSL
ncbi:diacylglycerol kinase (ATP) [Bacilli bacterium PM5-9]|nr:diacylglycerol kinase (ATP) [Bacilli bacterium PM5-9]